MEVMTSDFASNSLSAKVSNPLWDNVDFRYGDALGAAQFINFGRPGGYNNWRLPSKNEGILLCRYVRQVTSADCTGDGPGMRPGFFAWYWTADASDATVGLAWCMQLYDHFGGLIPCRYVDPNHVRFIRSF
jgi:hypothetical protein